MITLDKVNRTFESDGQNVQVLKDVSLHIDKNEFVVIFGPGQCGKTTLLNIIAGLDRATDGQVVVNKKTVNKPDPEIGMVYQDILLFPWLTTLKNVEFGPKVQGKDKKATREKALHYIDLVGLKGFEKAFPVKLSGGMKQRVGIARAYCNDPEVMLMDEPFGALDAQTRYLMQDEVLRISSAEKRTVVFVTNNIEEAVYLADRIIVLSRCPSTVTAEYVIDLPKPRNYTDPEFLRLRKEISAAIEQKR